MPKKKKVAVSRTWRGTHKGEHMGIAPTGKEARISGIEILRIVGGKIAEEWSESDWLGFLQQLGAKMARNRSKPAATTSPNTGLPTSLDFIQIVSRSSATLER